MGGGEKNVAVIVVELVFGQGGEVTAFCRVAALGLLGK